MSLSDFQHGIEGRIAVASSRGATWASGVYGLRLLIRYGVTRTVRVLGLFFWMYSLLIVPIAIRPDLLYPGDIGTDTSNYVAAAERLADGHDLYALTSGDRPAPLDNPPEWSVPILSPPPVATAYIWSTWLPDPIAFYLTWAIGLGAIAAIGAYVMTSGPVIFVPILWYLGQNVSVTAWSGNVNAWIGAISVFVWWAYRRRSRTVRLLAGALVALATAVKIGPAMLGLWLVRRGSSAAIVGAFGAGLAMIVVTFLAAGPGSFEDYLHIVRSASSTPAAMSIPGIVESLGGSTSAQTVAFLGVMIAAATAIVVLNRPRITFAIAAIAMAYATTVVRSEAVAVAILTMAVPWIATKPQSGLPPYRSNPGMQRPISNEALLAVATGAICAAVAVSASTVSGGLTRSSLAVTNSTTEPVIARLSLYIQSANFGFRLEPGQSAYGWSDRFGSSPPVVTLWTTDCRRLGLLWLPRTGSHVEVGARGAILADTMPDVGEYAPYVPDCATELIDFLDGSPDLEGE